MTTKAKLINDAYSIIKISGITVDPSAEDITLALNRLENMAAEFHGRNIITDYNFEENPSVNSLHNLERQHWFPYSVNLAARLLSDFGKEANPILVAQLKSAFSFLSSSTAPLKTTQYPSRMPIGLANSKRTYRWSHYNTPAPEAPLSAETIVMYINDVKGFTESFSAYLDTAETIASFTIEADDGLTIVSSANATPLITYVIKADGLSDGQSINLRQVKIVVTTSASRVETRFINFTLLDSDL